MKSHFHQFYLPLLSRVRMQSHADSAIHIILILFRDSPVLWQNG